MKKRKATRFACQIRNPKTGLFCLKSKTGKIRSCSPTRFPGVPVCRKRRKG